MAPIEAIDFSTPNRLPESKNAPLAAIDVLQDNFLVLQDLALAR